MQTKHVQRSIVVVEIKEPQAGADRPGPRGLEVKRWNDSEGTEGDRPPHPFARIKQFTLLVWNAPELYRALRRMGYTRSYALRALFSP
jgi:hypothetical protein